LGQKTPRSHDHHSLALLSFLGLFRRPSRRLPVWVPSHSSQRTPLFVGFWCERAAV